MNSLKSIIKISLFLFLSTIALLVWNDIKIIDKIKKEENKLLELKENQVILLQIRKAEKEFFATINMKYHTQVMELSHILHQQLNNDLQTKLLAYKTDFSKIAQSLKKIGVSDAEGLRKKFMQNSMKLENQVAYNNSLELLTRFFILRNAEKNFFLSHRQEDIELHQKEFQELLETNLNDKTKVFLKTYNKSFLAIVQEYRYIGFTKNLGLKKKMRSEIHNLENILASQFKISKHVIKNKIEKLYFLRYTFLIVAFIFFIFLLIIIIFPIQRSLFYFKSFFTTFDNSNERIEIKHLKYTELQEIGHTVNTMLTNREKVEHDLIDSRNEALRLQKAKEEFIANMSHELRTPLNAIIGFSSILYEEIPNREKIIKPILSSSQHLLHIINDILDVAKIRNNNFTIHKDTFNMHDELDSLLQEFQFSISKKNLLFHFDSNIKKDVFYYADWMRISQILHNLLSNAIKFTQENGYILLSMKANGGLLNVSVKDNGVGIPKDKQEQILKPFVQADSSTTKEYGGTGLGLSICKSLVSLMGGSLYIESEITKGSTFSFSIPFKEIDSSKESIEQAPINTLEQLQGHVLIVEDDEVNQVLLTMLLDKVGVTYGIANDGIEALECYKNHKFDVILMDENMPNMNGIEAMQEIKKEYQNPPPIIAITANVMKGDEARLLEAGMDGFLSKPIHPNQLFSILKSYLNT